MVKRQQRSAGPEEGGLPGAVSAPAAPLMPLDLPFTALRLTYRAQEPLPLPAFAGSKYEGAFGRALHDLSCVQPHRETCAGCLLLSSCAYGLTYHPQLPGHVHARSAQTPPRPVVFRTPVTAERTLQPGDGLSFDLTVTGAALTYLDDIVAALRALGAHGLGRSRAPVRLDHVFSVHPYTGQKVLLADDTWVTPPSAPIILTGPDLPPVTGRTLQVNLKAMTHLKVRGEMATVISFRTLIQALQRRISTLEQVHGGARSLGANFTALPDLAEEIQLMRHDVYAAQQRRKGSEPGQRVNVHGLMGTLTFSGDFTPFSTLLRYGEQLGVGTWAHFGAGLYTLSSPDLT